MAGALEAGATKAATDLPKVEVLAFAVRFHVATDVHLRRRSMREERASVQ